MKHRFNKYGPKRGPNEVEVDENEEIATLRKRAIDEAPASGSQLRSEGALRFTSMPLSSKTLGGLAVSKMEIATEIQAAAIPHALAGRDILGAAKTGSGKTLAFVIPLLERLYTEKWGLDDGLGAIIITPTRELALQIFDVIREIGKKHQISAGLVTGGKREFEEEQDRVIRTNVLVATPGRLLQHFEQTAGFDASNLQLLILDEADRILDMGFKTQLDGILEYLPVSRQTMLFSATQTKSVKDLARLSLKKPEYVAVHEKDQEVTPKQLVQNYIVVKLPDKLDVLFSFIKTHLKNKTIVFFSTCSQVRFVFELFRSMQPGIPLTALHGKIKQEKRTMVYMDFLQKKSACMFATDIASRGLDFPNIDWVVQVDAPEDSNMYIHRVGRTARYNSGGRALLLLLPNEEKPVASSLTEAGVPIKKLTVNPKHTVSVANKAAAHLAANPDCRVLAKKAFTGYLRSLQLVPSREPLEPSSLPVDDFAWALGLPFTPPPPVVPKGSSGREEVRDKKNVNRALDKLKKQIKAAKEEKKAAKLAATTATGSGSAAEDSKKDKKKTKKSKAVEEEEDEDSDEGEFLSVKRVHHANVGGSGSESDGSASDNEDDDGDDDEDSEGNQDTSGDDEASENSDANDSSHPQAVKSKSKLRKEKILKIKTDGVSKQSIAAGSKRMVFDDQGNTVDPLEKLVKGLKGEVEGGARSKDKKVVKEQVDEHAKQVKARLDQTRKEDVQRDQERVRQKHREKRLKENNDGTRGEGVDDDDDDNADDEEEGGGVQLATYSDDDEDRSGDDSDSDSDDGGDDDDDSSSEGLVLTSGRKRGRSSSDDEDSDDDSSNGGGGEDDDEDDGDDDDVDPAELKKREEMALKMLRKS